MRADSVMQLLLGPTVKGMGRNYTLEVRYRGMPEVMDEDELRRRGLSGEGGSETNSGARPRPLPQ
jgi:hypothetical protein